MKMTLIFILIVVVGFGFFLNLDISTKPIKKNSTYFTMEDLVLVEFATRLEELEYKFKDYHKTDK